MVHGECRDEPNRVEEARVIARLLEDMFGEMDSKEQRLVQQMAHCDHCTTDELLWLRDIHDKYRVTWWQRLRERWTGRLARD
jgi:hypothetical protein